MTTFPISPTTEPAAPPAVNERLWPSLSRPARRPQPAQGMDVLGETVRGMMARRRAGKKDRARAERIIARASELADLGESGFDEAVATARSEVLCTRESPVRKDQAASAVDAAYAVAYEAVRRELGLSLHPEQVMGALAMADGCCAEMATGEGKTVTAILPAALEGWSGRGVHVLTVNDYLAKRDAQTTSPAFRRLGLRVGVLQDSSKPEQRRRAYACDITYAADKQVIFDFLRDRLYAPLRPRLTGLLLDHIAGPGAGDRETDGDPRWAERIVQRGLHAAIVDEADSVLIDEGVTPAIIGQDAPAGGDGASAGTHFAIAAALAARLDAGEHYTVDARLHRVALTERGRARLAEWAADLPPFWAGPRRREELVTQALSAKELYRLGDDYIIQDGKIVIVDRSTGRMLQGRQWQLGLHQAVEAKERLATTGERRTTARISYQRFFQRYRRLCGMTGTGWEVAPELWAYYRLRVVRIPTHRPVQRERGRDRVFVRESDKFEAVAKRTAELHATGRPVLVGTRSVEASERLGALLTERGVPCQILNAEREAEEAAIVAQAGRLGAVTVATNMAGRGTDILLEPRTRELGGLVVIATEHHEEARVDRQLYGRAGRQGDPGRAEVFVSLDDALIVRHGSPLLARLCRAAALGRSPLLNVTARVLWGLAQWSASRRAVMARREAVKSEAWLELAMHHESR